MIDRRIGLKDWIRHPGNLERYRAWLENETTQVLLELVERTIRAEPVISASSEDRQQEAVERYHELAGMTRLFYLLLHADTLLGVEEEPDTLTDYERESLRELYTDEEIYELMKGSDDGSGI